MSTIFGAPNENAFEILETSGDKRSLAYLPPTGALKRYRRGK
jgi:hypothetical protein